MKIELSPREVSILVECCCRAPACVEEQGVRDLIHKLKFSHIELEPFRRVPQNQKFGTLQAVGCDDGVGGGFGDIKKVRRLVIGQKRK